MAHRLGRMTVTLAAVATAAILPGGATTALAAGSDSSAGSDRASGDPEPVRVPADHEHLSRCDGHRRVRVIAAGDCLIATSDGFAPASPVSVRLGPPGGPVADGVTDTADEHGVVQHRFVVPTTAHGQQVLSIVGPVAPKYDGRRATAPNSTIVATVPRVWIARFTVR